MLFDRQLWRQARSHSLALLFTLVSGLGAAVFTLLQAYYIARLVNAAFLEGMLPGELWRGIWPVAVAIILRAIFQYLTDITSAEIGLRIKENLREKVLEKVQSTGALTRSIDRSGETISTLTDGLETLDPYFSQYVPQLLLAAVVPLAILMSITKNDWLSFAVLLVTAPLLPVFMILLGSISQKSTNAQWQKLHRLGSFFYETIQGIHVLLSFNVAKERGQELEEKDEDYRSLTMQVLRLTFLSAFVLEFISTIGTAVIAVEIGLRLLNGSLEFRTALFVLLLAPEFYLPLRQLGARFHAGMSGKAAAVQVFNLLGEEPDQLGMKLSSHPPFSPQVENNPSILKGKTYADYSRYFPIRLEAITARYPDAEREVLSKIDLSLNQGTHLALIGPSGEGKTTLAMILMGILLPVEGRLTFGGIPASDYPVNELSKLFCWVPQTPYIFAGTIAENICLFDPQAQDEVIREAGRSAMLDSWLQELPDGYQTKVGERGFTISTGQAQRLALARAFYRNSPILILDEPTASLDVALEADLVRSIEILTRGRTVVNIAHRMGSIRNSSMVFRVEEGRLRPVSQIHENDLLPSQTDRTVEGGH